jgi:hypothetical protein
MLDVLGMDIEKQIAQLRRSRLATGLVAATLLAAACGPSQEPRVPIASFLASEQKLYSQRNEELLIRHYFRDRRGGFFLDVGAYHWMEASTTLYLEKHLGWHGIAIDANAAFGPDYAEYRPGTTFLSFFVTDHSGGGEKLFLRGPVSSQSRQHIESFTGTEDTELLEAWVPAITLNDLLDRNGVEKLDFLSMDIELGEPAALAGFDIERFRPELVCIEVSPSTLEPISAYFAEHGYVRIEEYGEHDSVNWYFRPGDS